MAYRYLEHTADIGLLATGKAVEEAFSEGARGMFNVMVDTKLVSAIKRVEVTVTASSIETLYVEWLNALLAKRDIKGMFFSKFKVRIESGRNLKLVGEAWGDKITPNLNLRTEVKAATYSGLEYKEVDGVHHIKCVLDV